MLVTRSISGRECQPLGRLIYLCVFPSLDALRQERTQDVDYADSHPHKPGLRDVSAKLTLRRARTSSKLIETLRNSIAGAGWIL